MKAVLRLGTALVLLWGPASRAHAQVETAVRGLGQYRAITTWQEQAWSLARTPEEKMNVLRATVRRGRHSGDARLRRMFNNFEGDFAFNPDLPGLRTAVRLTASDSRNVAFGSARTLRYAGVLNGDARFELTGLNRPIVNSAGKTDADIAFRHLETGKRGRMEVKDWGPAGQRRGLARAERQFRKMATDRRETGRVQAWVNRRPNIPQIEELGRRYGVPVYGSVATGRAVRRPGQPDLRRVLDDLDRRVASLPRALSGGAQLGFGAYQLVTSGPLAWDAVEALLDGDRDADASLCRLGQHLSMTAAGGFFSVAGGIQIARGLGQASKLAGLSRWSGRFGVATTALAGGLVALQWYRGAITEREFTRSWVALGGGAILGAGGAWGGALGGAAIGSAFGPVGTVVGTVIGGLAGGFGGGWLGSSFASRALESHYELKDRQMERERVRYLYSLHGLRLN